MSSGSGRQQRQRRHPVARIKGGWSAAEDAELARLVHQLGEGNWSMIARALNEGFDRRRPADQGRIGKQCRERWNHHLRPDIKKDAWTEEEERKLIKAHMALGNKWSDIARQLPGRTENAVKNLWNATLRRKETAPGAGPQILREYMQRCGLLKGGKAAASSSGGNANGSGSGTGTAIRKRPRAALRATSAEGAEDPLWLPGAEQAAAVRDLAAGACAPGGAAVAPCMSAPGMEEDDGAAAAAAAAAAALCCAPKPCQPAAAAAVPSGTRVVLPQRAARAAAQRRGRAVVDESSESDNEQGDSSGSDWEAERECETWSDEEDDVEEEEEEKPGAAAGGAKRQKRRSASGAQFQDLKAAAWLGGGVQLAACASLQPPEANVTSVTVAAIRSPTAAACQDTAAAAADLEAAAAGSTQGDSQQSLLAEVLEWMDDEEEGIMTYMPNAALDTDPSPDQLQGAIAASPQQRPPLGNHHGGNWWDSLPCSPREDAGHRLSSSGADLQAADCPLTAACAAGDHQWASLRQLTSTPGPQIITTAHSGMQQPMAAASPKCHSGDDSSSRLFLGVTAARGTMAAPAAGSPDLLSALQVRRSSISSRAETPSPTAHMAALRALRAPTLVDAPTRGSCNSLIDIGRFGAAADLEHAGMLVASGCKPVAGAHSRPGMGGSPVVCNLSNSSAAAACLSVQQQQHPRMPWWAHQPPAAAASGGVPPGSCAPSFEPSDVVAAPEVVVTVSEGAAELPGWDAIMAVLAAPIPGTPPYGIDDYRAVSGFRSLGPQRVSPLDVARALAAAGGQSSLVTPSSDAGDPSSSEGPASCAVTPGTKAATAAADAALAADLRRVLQGIGEAARARTPGSTGRVLIALRLGSSVPQDQNGLVVAMASRGRAEGEAVLRCALEAIGRLYE